MNRSKIFISSLLFVFCFLTLSAAEKAPQEAKNKPKTVVAKSYTFAEELIELPIKPFVVAQISNSELMNTSPQLLKLYEAAVNAEKQKNAFQNAHSIIKAWAEIVKITQQNPFLTVANQRLAEWKNCVELFNRHLESLKKVNMLVESTLIPDGQKTEIILQHLDGFGLSFGTQEIIDSVAKTSIPGDSAFQAKIKETRNKRCEHNSGKDCFDCARDSATAENEKLALFAKSCDLKYQPGCDEANKIKAAQEAEKAKIAAEEKRKAEEFASRTFVLIDEPVNLLPPFVLGQISNQDILAADPKVLKMFEDTVNKEKQSEIAKTPGTMIVAWEEITKITENNPFMQAAVQRLAEWKACLDKLEKYEVKTAEMKKIEADQSLPVNYRTAFAVNYLNEYGLTFGTTEAVKATLYSSEITYNEAFTSKVKEIRKQRCDLKSAVDCQTYGLKNAATDEEKAEYLKKACDLGRQAACPEGQQPPVTAAQAPVENTQPQVAEQPKEPEKKLSDRDKFKEELNQAGRKNRLAIATSTLVSGVVISALGGAAFYGMNKYDKKRSDNYQKYLSSVTTAEADYFRKQANDADKKRKTYLALGGVGIGIGAALIATGITFYSIEFEGEKEVKKKYNVSFGANPMDGSLQFAINW